MCYTVSQLKKREFDSAVREGLPKEVIDKLFVEWQELEKDDNGSEPTAKYKVSGFEHPKLNVVLNDGKLHGDKFNWGLIPEWVKDSQQAKEISNKTLNARGETIFEKEAFRKAAIEQRCLIFVDGFFEHHHHKNKKYPYYIRPKNENMPLVFGGLWSQWVDQLTGEIVKTTTIVTTEGNPLMKKIHNNPKLHGARMPLILTPINYSTWLNATSKQEIQQLILPFDVNELEAFTVQKIIGKDALLDGPECIKFKEYPELSVSKDLFD